MKNLALLIGLTTGCYSAGYLPIDAQGLDTIDVNDRVEVVGTPPPWILPAADEIDAWAQAAIAHLGTRSEYVPCVERFVLVVPPDLDAFSAYCRPENGACMCANDACASADLGGRWLMVIRPDLAHHEGLAPLVEHEIAHAMLWCTTGRVDSGHRSPIWRTLQVTN